MVLSCKPINKMTFGINFILPSQLTENLFALLFIIWIQKLCFYVFKWFRVAL